MSRGARLAHVGIPKSAEIREKRRGTDAASRGCVRTSSLPLNRLSLALVLLAGCSSASATATGDGGSAADVEAGPLPDGGGSADGDAAGNGDAGFPFATQPGSSLLVDGIDSIVVSDRTDPVAGGWNGECGTRTLPGDRLLGNGTYTFTVATSAFAYKEHCAQGDGGAPTDNAGQRTLSASESADLLAALRATQIKAYTPAPSDAEYTTIALTASGQTVTYFYWESSHAPGSLLVERVFPLLDAAHGLAHP
jgi:hypothetical protein